MFQLRLNTISSKHICINVIVHFFPFIPIYYSISFDYQKKKKSQPPSCDRNGRNYRHRARRDTYDAVVVPTTSGGQYPNLATALASRLASQKGDKDMSMEVYSGLYVDENENTKNGIDDELEDDDDDGMKLLFLTLYNVLCRSNNRLIDSMTFLLEHIFSCSAICYNYTF